jgi:hypothetical protein
MGTPTPPLQSPPNSPFDLSDVRDLVRQELDRNNSYLVFAQGQISQDRTFYKHLYTFAGAFLALLVTFAGVFQYTSVSQMRTDMKASVDAELERDKAEIAALRAQATMATTEAQSTVSKELANVRTEVQKRVDNEFRSENITALVQDVAKGKTEKELAGIIRSETSSQVAKGIQEQGPVIQKAVEDQTRQAVKAMEPTISSTVAKEMESQVQKSVAPIQNQMRSYGDLIAAERLATFGKEQ